MKQAFSVFVLCFGFTSVNLVADCKVWDPKLVKDWHFVEETEKTRIKELADPNWIRTLPVFSAEDKATLAVSEVKTGGAVLQRGFKVSVGGKDKYFIKRTFCTDVMNAFKISQTSLVDPKCILGEAKIREDLASFVMKDVSDVPHFARVVGVHALDDYTCDAMMDLAPGVEAYKIPYTDKEVFRNIGRKTALLHALGYVHADLSRWNLLYDAQTQTITLIDYADLRQDVTERSRNDDLQSLVVEPASLNNLQELYFPFTVVTKHLQAQLDMGKSGGLLIDDKDEVLVRFENYYSSVWELLEGYFQPLPKGVAEKRAKEFVRHVPIGGLRSLEQDFLLLDHFLKFKAHLPNKQVEKFWELFPSLQKISELTFLAH